MSGAPVSASMLLKSNMAHSITLTELQHLRVQYRLVAALLAGAMMFYSLLDPAVLLLGTDDALVSRAAMATKLGPAAIAHVFIVLAAILVPFMALQLGVWERRRRGITQLACVSMALASLVWFFLAWRCIPLDLGPAPLVFARYGAGALLFALALAYSLNAEQIRTVLERAK